MSQTLSSLLKSKSLISVRRNGVDDYEIQGFLIGLSDELIALEYVYDFQIDGLLVMRRPDVSEVKRTATAQFQERLLKHEGIRPGHLGLPALNLESWRSLIEQLNQVQTMMILERELGPAPELLIGKVIRATAAQVEFQAFSGVGRWFAKADRIKYSHLTSLQCRSRYINFYQRYFDQQQHKSSLKPAD